MNRDLANLQNILRAIELLADYTATQYEDFLSQTVLQDATIRQLEIIGETVKRLSPETKELRPEIPWRRIARMRDGLIHRYETVDLDIVWDTAINYVPTLREAVSEMSEILSRD